LLVLFIDLVQMLTYLLSRLDCITGRGWYLAALYLSAFRGGILINNGITLFTLTKFVIHQTHFI